MDHHMIEVEVENEDYDILVPGFLHFDAHYDQGYPETLYTPAEPAGYEVDNVYLLCDWTPLKEELASLGRGAVELRCHFLVAGEKNFVTVSLDSAGSGWEVESVEVEDAEPSIELYISEYGL
jgi:hypothetical protein